MDLGRDRPENPDLRLTLLATILGSATVFVDSTVVNVALPAIGRDLDATSRASRAQQPRPPRR